MAQAESALRARMQSASEEHAASIRGCTDLQAELDSERNAKSALQAALSETTAQLRKASSDLEESVRRAQAALEEERAQRQKERSQFDEASLAKEAELIALHHDHDDALLKNKTERPGEPCG